MKHSNTARKITDPNDGSVSWEINTKFDVTDEGVSFGRKNNYNPRFIKTLVNSKSTKQAVTKGYSLVMYGHFSREEKFDMYPTENHPISGETQFPLGRVTRVSIDGKYLSLTMILAEAKGNHAETVVQLMKHGIGGFSTFFAVDDKQLRGVDFVLTRNFADNQVDTFLWDSFLNVCNGGSCTLESKLREEVEQILGEDRLDLLEPTMQLLKDNPTMKKGREASEGISKKNREILSLKKQLDAFQRELESANHRIRHLEDELSKPQPIKTVLKPIIQEVEIIPKDLEDDRIHLKKLLSLMLEKGIDYDEDKKEINANRMMKDSFIDNSSIKSRVLNIDALSIALKKDKKNGVHMKQTIPPTRKGTYL